MKKIIGACAAAALLIAVPSAHASTATAYAACSNMTFETYMGSSNNGFAPPESQATFIAASQQWQGGSFTLEQAQETNFPEGINFNCVSRYEYRDYYGLYRLIKITTHPQYDGNGGVQAWSQWSRYCYYRTSPSNSWTSWSC